jgi:RPA family protein
MSERISYKRNPAIQCWIKHIVESEFDENENLFHTIFGKVKRIRIIGTIIEKTEDLTEIDEYNIGLEDDAEENIQLIFKIDDGTSLIRAVIDSVNPEKFRNYNRGHIVDVVGRPRKKEGILSLWIEIIRKVEEPNQILLRDAEIIRRIKSGDIQKITVMSDNKTDELSKEIDVNNLFEEK